MTPVTAGDSRVTALFGVLSPEKALPSAALLSWVTGDSTFPIPHTNTHIRRTGGGESVGKYAESPSKCCHLSPVPELSDLDSIHAVTALTEVPSPVLSPEVIPCP